jgi:hypothetical protein
VNVPSGIVLGETEASTGTGFSSAIAAPPVSVASVLLVAAIAIESEGGRDEGAVYRPPELILPNVEFPPTTPFTDHTTVALPAIAPLPARLPAADMPLPGAGWGIGIDEWDEVDLEVCTVSEDWLAPGMMAENCCEAPARTVADEGVILIPELPLRAQPDMNNAANRRAQQRMQV